MTREITYTAGLRVAKDNVFEEMGLGGALYEDFEGNNYAKGTLDLIDEYETIPLGDVTSPHFACFENLGANPIGIREDLTGLARFVLKPGQRIVVGLGPGMQAPRAAAMTSTSRLKYLIVED